jgi:hypothetical protein
MVVECITLLGSALYGIPCWLCYSLGGIMNTTEIAIKSGLVYEDVEGSGMTYWTDGNFEEALDKFAELVIEAYKKEGGL